jgi:hypothetical protein
MRRDTQFVAFAGALLAAFVFTSGAGAAPAPYLSAEFTVPASNGYTLDVKSERGQLTLIAFRESAPVAHITDAGRLLPAGEGNYASATYYAPATGGPEAIAADLGPLGRIDVAFQPSGQTRVTHLSQRGKSTDCTFPHRIVRRLGTFVGTISFHGENGYTSLDLASAPGSIGTSPFRNCSTKRGTVSREGVFGQAGPDVFLSAADPPSHISFGASTLGPGSGFFASFVELLPSGLAVIRAAQAHASGALAFDPGRHVATLRPPAPFSGAATYRRDAAHPWSGSLAVDFPGVTVPLTGPSFKAQMRLDE